MTELRYDVIELGATIDANGWIRDKPVVTRAGIFEYKTIDGKVKREFRPATEVFSTDSLSSLLGIPVTDQHRGIINHNNTSGIIGTVLSSGIKTDEDVVAEIIIHDAGKLGKKRELSLGYVCEVDETPGEWNGEKYDSIQKNIKYNHLAVVNKGRAGNAKLRLDHDDAASFPFDPMEKKMPDDTNKFVVIRLDNIDYQSAPEVINAYNKAQGDLVALQKRFDSMEADRDSFKARLSDAEKQVDIAKATARSVVKARLDLEQIAEGYKIKCDEDEDDRILKVKVLGKLRPELKLDGKSDEYIDSAFDLALAYNNDKTKKLSLQMKKFDSVVEPVSNTSISSMDARARMLARIRGEKQEVA